MKVQIDKQAILKEKDKSKNISKFDDREPGHAPLREPREVRDYTPKYNSPFSESEVLEEGINDHGYDVYSKNQKAGDEYIKNKNNGSQGKLLTPVSKPKIITYAEMQKSTRDDQYVPTAPNESKHKDMK